MNITKQCKQVTLPTSDANLISTWKCLRFRSRSLTPFKLLQTCLKHGCVVVYVWLIGCVCGSVCGTSLSILHSRHVPNWEKSMKRSSSVTPASKFPTYLMSFKSFLLLVKMIKNTNLQCLYRSARVVHFNLFILRLDRSIEI